MATRHPTEQVLHWLQDATVAGSESAQQLLNVLEACTQTLDSTDGLELVPGIVGDSVDEICAQQLDDALADLFPVLLKACAGGWDGLKFYAPPDMPFPEKK